MNKSEVGDSSGSEATTYVPFDRLYRPQRFSEILGQDDVIRELIGRVRSRQMPGAILLSGPRGVGKTTTARIIGKALNCEEPQDGEPCGACPPCRALSSLSVLNIAAADHTSVEDARFLGRLVSYQHSGKWRVIILDEAHRMSPQAFDALLTPLEEPPPETTFVLVTTEASHLPETIRSRSARYEFGPLSDEVITKRLWEIADERGIQATEQDLEHIVIEAQGAMRDALIALEQLAHAGADANRLRAKPAEERRVARELLGAALRGDRMNAGQIITAAARGDRAAPSLIEPMLDLLGDLMGIQAGEGSVARSAAERAEATKLAGSVSGDAIYSAMTALGKMPARTSGGGSPIGHLWAVYVALTEGLTKFNDVAHEPSPRLPSPPSGASGDME